MTAGQQNAEKEFIDIDHIFAVMLLQAGKRNGKEEWKMKWEIEKILIFFFNFSVSDLLFITEERNDCRERNKLMARKEMSFEEQIIPKNNYTSIFAQNRGFCVSYP